MIFFYRFCWIGITDFDADHTYTWENGTDINQSSLYFNGERLSIFFTYLFVCLCIIISFIVDKIIPLDQIKGESVNGVYCVYCVYSVYCG